jgi:hypothetical protein
MASFSIKFNYRISWNSYSRGEGTERRTEILFRYGFIRLMQIICKGKSNRCFATYCRKQVVASNAIILNRILAEYFNKPPTANSTEVQYTYPD